MKMGVDGVPDIKDYIASRLSVKTIGFDGRIVSHQMGKQIEDVCGHHVSMIHDLDLVGDIWTGPPGNHTVTDI